MVKLSRRWFLLGSSASIAAASVPAVRLVPAAPIFDGVIGEYNGILIKAAREAALAARLRIRPIRDNDGRDYYVAFVHPKMIEL